MASIEELETRIAQKQDQIKDYSAEVEKHAKTIDQFNAGLFSKEVLKDVMTDILAISDFIRGDYDKRATKVEFRSQMKVLVTSALQAAVNASSRTQSELQKCNDEHEQIVNLEDSKLKPASTELDSLYSSVVGKEAVLQNEVFITEEAIRSVEGAVSALEGEVRRAEDSAESWEDAGRASDIGVVVLLPPFMSSDLEGGVSDPIGLKPEIENKRRELETKRNELENSQNSLRNLQASLRSVERQQVMCQVLEFEAETASSTTKKLVSKAQDLQRELNPIDTATTQLQLHVREIQDLVDYAADNDSATKGEIAPVLLKICTTVLFDANYLDSARQIEGNLMQNYQITVSEEVATAEADFNDAASILESGTRHTIVNPVHLVPID